MAETGYLFQRIIPGSAQKKGSLLAPAPDEDEEAVADEEEKAEAESTAKPVPRAAAAYGQQLKIMG